MMAIRVIRVISIRVIRVMRVMRVIRPANGGRTLISASGRYTSVAQWSFAPVGLPPYLCSPR